jgi:hypothetical protein
VTRWNGKARRETDEFSEFVYLYFCVNALMSNLSEEHTDRGALNWIYNNANPLREVWERFHQRKSIDDCIARLSQLPPVPTHRSPPRPEHLTISDAGTLSEVMDYIYQVRCNLFHGRKDPQDEWDVAYVRACNAILKPLVRAVISDFDGNRANA